MPIGFSRLRITGFKSFAEPQVVEIRAGLTGIVGPNGCGKSNVVEALRWAMGESSARSLRGGEMDDVIFAGTTHRPARNLADVTLTLEAAGAPGTFPAPFHEQSELEVSRRIERGGGSAYRVNGKEARARDVQTLFADMASGARSSAMVSQGRVGSLVNARPDERRSILEEAAGIGGLHARRHEAELKLRAAEANLARAEDLRTQLGSQFAGLQKQARQAARYRSLSGLVRAAEAELLGVQQARTRQARDAARARLGALQQAIERAGADAQARQHASRAAGAALPPVRAAEATARTALERHRLSCEQVDAEQARARTALAAARDALRRIEADLLHAGQLHRDAQSAEQRLAAEASRLAAELGLHPELAGQADAAVAEAEAATRAADGAMQAFTAEAAFLAARGQALSEARARAEARFTNLDAVFQALKRERAGLENVDAARLDAARLAHEAAGLAAREAALALDGAESARIAAQATLHEARTRLHAAEPIRARLAAEQQALSELLGVHETGSARLVDALHVPEGLEAAIGAALGEDLELTDDPQAARYFRLLDAPDATVGLPEGAAPLAGLVQAPAVLARVLCQIGLVETDGATLQASLHPGQMLVSRDGAVWRWDGYVQKAGAATAAAVRLRQRNRLSDLRIHLAGAEQVRVAAQRDNDAAISAERAAIAAEAAGRQARRDTEQAAERRRQELLELQRRADSVAGRIAALDGQIERFDAEHRSAGAERDAARQAQAGLADLAAARARVDAARSAQATARAAEQRARSHQDALQRQASFRQGRQRAIIAERAGWSDRARDAEARLGELSSRRGEAAATQAGLEDLPEQLDASRSEARETLAAAEQAHRIAAAALQQAEHDAATADRADRQAEAAVASAREAVLRAEADCREADHAWGTVAERVLERLGADPELPVLDDVSPEAEDKARRKLDRLCREREDMGPVNLRADIEAGEIEARLSGIDAERDELGSAIAKLRGSIGHLNREGRERLSAVFTEVDRHFQLLFGRMFGGGRAQLALVGSDDPLLAGLEIYAQPPGKKLAALSLLSGGEQALTALSLIFAVFRCNPAPVCVLDEVDAPLDDANIERFCALLEDMVRETGTRFLVVTHHHLTMSRMDRLYGVTMQERGVSRLLSVDLKVAAEMVEPVPMAAE